ncbi:MAG: gliding motility-associated C-terminal domain-containing protein, partial [Chitinophagaceae bacterium]|nr:gliding motility-associated C-terminal domain-containing protein [Chitinophagaceae bacterium]
NDGTITVNATGGNGSYQYSIDNGATWQSGNVFNVAPGNYTVSVRDNLNCTATFNTTVGLTNNLSFTAQTDPTICESKSTQLDLVSNATQYVWTPATGLSNTTIHNPVANPVVTTEYIVTATLGRCSVNDTVIVNVNAAPVPDAGTDGFICYGQTYQLNAGGGTVYKWTPSTYLDNPNIPNPISTPAKDITYTVTILSDANGCASLVTDEMRIDVTPPVKVKTFPYDTIGYPGDRFMLMAVPSDPDANIYTWTPSTGLSNPNIANPIVTIGPIGSDLTYQVITSTIAGCKGEGYVHIKIYTGPDIYVPTGFTPNGDGRNDRFTPFPVGIKGLNYFRVFNRWGQLVFSTNTLHQGWDGKLGGTDQPTGTYVWMAEGISNNGKVITKKGVVTLIR